MIQAREAYLHNSDFSSQAIQSSRPQASRASVGSSRSVSTEFEEQSSKEYPTDTMDERTRIRLTKYSQKAG
jgi:hypothetical protein